MRRMVSSAAGLIAAALAAGLSACSGGGHPASDLDRSAPPVSTTTVMIDGNKHTMTATVECAITAARHSATPPESGGLTTRVKVHDDASSVLLTLSDETPPSVDGFAISLRVGNGQFRFPYQAPRSAIQVQAAKDGKSYTVTGTGQASTPGQSGLRRATFGVHVTCP